MKSLSLLFLLATFTYLTHSQIVSKGSVIGIVTVPSDTAAYPEDQFSYFYASYVKYLQQAGAQVVPIPYDISQERITFLLERLNGVLFTGGGAEFEFSPGVYTPFGATINFITKYVIEQNSKGKYYPLWGTCMGFQGIAGMIAKNFTILTGDCIGCDGVNKNNFWNEAYPNSKLYSGLPAGFKEKMTTDNLSVFYHRYMFHAETFQKTSILNTTLIPITFSYDTQGKKYVSSYESPTMPIYATQYHPEKNAFEWRTAYQINRHPDTIVLQHYLADFFVNETRKNTNTFPEIEKYTIENYQVTIVPTSTVSAHYFFPTTKIKENPRFRNSVTH